MGTEQGDIETDMISTGDIKTAFLQGYGFDKTLPKQYVGLRPYPGAEVEVCEANAAAVREAKEVSLLMTHSVAPVSPSTRTRVVMFLREAT